MGILRVNVNFKGNFFLICRFFRDNRLGGLLIVDVSNFLILSYKLYWGGRDFWFEFFWKI